MIGMIGKGLTALGKGTIGAGKLGLKLFFPLLDLEWYGGAVLKPFKEHTSMFKSIYTKPGCHDNMFRMSPKYNFKSLTKMSRALEKIAQAGGGNWFTRTVSTLRQIDQGVSSIDNIINRVGNIANTGVSLYDRFLRPPAPTPNYGRMALLGALGGAGILGLYKLYKTKQEEARRRMLGNELYNRYLYYRMYPLQKTSSVNKTAGISDIISSAINSLKGVGSTLGGAAADTAQYLGSIGKQVGQYIVENPVKSTLVGIGAYTAAKDLLEEAGLKQMATTPKDEELMEVARYIAQADPFLQQVNPGDIYSALKSIAMYNPVIVKDPAAVTSIVKQVISFGGISPDLIKTLTDSYKNYTSARKNLQTGSSLVSTIGRLFT